MAGLAAVGDFYRKSGANMVGAASELELKREAANERMEQQDKAGTLQAAGTGASIGAMIGAGTSVGGPWGAVIGAGIGLLADSMLS